MKGIGGNLTVQLQVRSTATNDIGEQVETWVTVQSITGWLDLMNGDSKYSTYNAKIQESTHVFIADYRSLDARLKSENGRVLTANRGFYDILLIDDPMELHKQLEFYLKYTGGQDGTN